MDKIYEFQSTRSGGIQVLHVMKWLRSQGVLDVDFKIHDANYSRLRVEFLNEAVELGYVLKFHRTWVK